MIQTEEIVYNTGELVCRAFVAYPKATTQKPCVLVAHDWSGRNEMSCNKAEQLATMGYVGFALDMYGNAAVGKTTEEKQALLDTVITHREQVTTRMLAAFQTASKLPQVNEHKMAAIGYCFGGLCVLDLARSGADVKAVVSFHGLLTAPESTVCEKIRAKILVLHGYDDPLVPPAQVVHFANEMTTRKVDWQIHMYGQTKHSFTNPEANDAKLGLHYNEKADHRSWKSMEDFLNETFLEKKS